MTMRNAHCPPRQTTADGFILVAVLWIMAALATLAAIFSIYLGNTAVSLSANDNSVQSEALVFAALELTTYQVSASRPAGPQQAGSRTGAEPNVGPPQTRNAPPPPTRGDFSFRLARANVAVNFISEAARIDLNVAPLELLANFFAVLGIEPQQAAQYAQRIAGWTTKPKATQSTAAAEQSEEALYRAAGRSYSPRGGPFAHIDELSLVVGLPPALIERAKPFLTIYSGKKQIDILDAAPEVVAAIPGVTPNMLNTLAEARNAGADPQAVARMLGGAALQDIVSVDGGDTYRVQVSIRYDDGRRAAAEVVIVVGQQDKPYRVLSWRDGLDAVSTETQLPASLRR